MDAIKQTNVNLDVLLNIDEKVSIDDKYFNLSRLIYGVGTSKQDWLSWDGLSELNTLKVETAFEKDARILILSPHPDDEILGCAGLIQALDELGREVMIIGVTNGTQSHPNSKKYTVDELNRIRPKETRDALNALNLKQDILYQSFDLDDGRLNEQKKEIEEKLTALIQKNDILITTFEKDGHPDHEHLGALVSKIAKQRQLKCYQVLIWAWHWAQPNDTQIAWSSALRLDLNPQQLAFKSRAIKCFKSQIEHDETTQQAAIIPPHVIDRILMPFEVYIHAQ